MFELNAYATYESERCEREARLRQGALLEELAAQRLSSGQHPRRAPARWLGLLLIRVGRRLQSASGTRRPGAITVTIERRYAPRRRAAALCSTHTARPRGKREAASSR